MKKTVVYVDDNEEMFELVRLVLANSGYRILTKKTGQAVLDLCANESPDLILMDLNMPDMDGFATTQKLRGQGYTHPIVVFSASNKERDHAKAKAAGCNAYLVKDLEMKGLEGIIDQFLAEAGGID